MPPVPQGVQTRRGPSWTDKLLMGSLMGGTVGSIMGFIYGTVTIFQHGAGTAGVFRTLGRYMGGLGSMFAVMMGVGSLIRSDTNPMASEIWRRAQYPPLVHRRPLAATQSR